MTERQEIPLPPGPTRSPDIVPTAHIHDTPGWYGKLACLGDFAHRRLPPDWLRVCNEWLSSALVQGRERSVAAWLDVYLTAPPLRFAWAPGVVDAQWWFGLLMPSCDNVGRYFPLLVAHPRARAPEDRFALDHLELWFEHMERAAMATLHDSRTSVDALERDLAGAPPWPTPGSARTVDAMAGAGAATGVNAHATPFAEHLRIANGAGLSPWLQTYAARQLAARLTGCSVWWRVDKAAADDDAFVLKGLPDGAALMALFRGPSGHG